MSANWISKDRRHALIAAAGGACAYCGAALDVRSGSYDGLDHVTPRAAGGSNDPSNLVAACGPCNASKSAHHVGAWLTQTTRGRAALARLAGCLVAVAAQG